MCVCVCVGASAFASALHTATVTRCWSIITFACTRVDHTSPSPQYHPTHGTIPGLSQHAFCAQLNAERVPGRVGCPHKFVHIGAMCIKRRNKPLSGKATLFFWCVCVVVMIKYANTNFRYKLLLVRRPHTFACVRNINILFGSEKHSATFQTHDEFPAIPGIWAYTGIDNTHRNLCLSVYPCPTPHMHGSGCNAQSSIKYCTRARFACACTLENLHFSQYKCVVCRICILLHVYIKDNGYEGTPT